MSDWEEKLEDALCDAAPEGVLDILRRIKMWTYGYCVTCGVWNDTNGGKRGCKCEVKGEWND